MKSGCRVAVVGECVVVVVSDCCGSYGWQLWDRVRVECRGRLMWVGNGCHEQIWAEVYSLYR